MVLSNVLLKVMSSAGLSTNLVNAVEQTSSSIGHIVMYSRNSSFLDEITRLTGSHHQDTGSHCVSQIGDQLRQSNRSGYVTGKEVEQVIKKKLLELSSSFYNLGDLMTPDVAPSGSTNTEELTERNSSGQQTHDPISEPNISALVAELSNQDFNWSSHVALRTDGLWEKEAGLNTAKMKEDHHLDRDIAADTASMISDLSREESGSAADASLYAGNGQPCIKYTDNQLNVDCYDRESNLASTQSMLHTNNSSHKSIVLMDDAKADLADVSTARFPQAESSFNLSWSEESYVDISERANHQDGEYPNQSFAVSTQTIYGNRSDPIKRCDNEDESLCQMKLSCEGETLADEHESTFDASWNGESCKVPATNISEISAANHALSDCVEPRRSCSSKINAESEKFMDSNNKFIGKYFDNEISSIQRDISFNSLDVSWSCNEV